MNTLPNIPIGILPNDKRVEFFASDGEVFATTSGGTIPYDQFTDRMHLAIIGHMSQNPNLVKWVQKKTKKDFGGDFSKRYTYYIFGGLNLTPDIDLDGTMNGCDFYCCDEEVPMILSINNGKSLSKREIQVLKLVTMPDQVIADHLYNSRETILSHMQNMRSKTGLTNKSELTRLAVQQGVI